MRDDFGSIPTDTSAVIGDEIVLSCTPPRGHPKPLVKWVKDGDVLDLTGDRRVAIEEGGDLVIRGARRSDQGRYQCSAENVASRRLSKPARVKINGELKHNFISYTVYD